ncbi:hypothetical protein FXO38_07224 [Capsicum annuum]|nr:hypothetical protein FXO37_09250 [Capsicum annuum]KAF3670149.1 hypothetical protein FXO38_07224 [Capsicum annuum]
MLESKINTHSLHYNSAQPNELPIINYAKTPSTFIPSPSFQKKPNLLRSYESSQSKPNPDLPATSSSLPGVGAARGFNTHLLHSRGSNKSEHIFIGGDDPAGSRSGYAYAFMENREVMFIIQTPELLAHLASEGMRRAMELYNSHLWMSTVLQAPMNFSIPALPFFHLPTWETPTVLVQQPQ